jgi:DNA-binding winged helix-turn-helix (wHTH) protein/TolB-like protein
MDPPRRIRFGAFDFEPSSGELRRDGTHVRLQSQPAQVLALLLAQPGEIVTREALREAIWGSQTFVDFDRGLNFCVSQIRAALKDSAESPVYVKTLPKRGYQFIAPVDSPPRESIPPSRPVPFTSRKQIAKWVIVTPPVLIGILALALLEWHPGAPPESVSRSAPRLAVARFDNETGDPGFNRFADGLTDSVVAELTASSSGRYAVIGNASILRRPRDQRDLAAIATSLQAGYVVLGQVQGNSSHLIVLAHLIRLPEQTHLWVARFEFAATDPIARQLELARSIARQFSAHFPRDPASPGASSPAATN